MHVIWSKPFAVLRPSSAEQLEREVTSIFEKYDQWADDLTEQYDDETKHGTKPKEQQEWAECIRNCIETGSSLCAPMR